MKTNLVSLFSGSGVGLLLGCLMGLAVSPVVGVIIGALASILAVILGLNEQHFSIPKGLRIGAFGFSCVIGAVVGVFMRTYAVLEPGIQQQKQIYLDTGYSEEQALDFIAYQKFSIVNEDWSMIEVQRNPANSDKKDEQIMASASQLVQNRSTGVLFSAGVDTTSCDQLAKVSPELSNIYFLNKFTTLGNVSVWGKLANNAEYMFDEDQQKPVLLNLKNSACQEAPVKFDPSDCENLRSLKPESTVNEVVDRFRSQSSVWKRIADNITNVEPTLQKRTLMLARNSFCDI